MPLKAFEKLAQPSKAAVHTPRRLAAALAADELQAQGSVDRLSYYLVSLDGGGRLIEQVRQARRRVDELLIEQKRSVEHPTTPNKGSGRDLLLQLPSVAPAARLSRHPRRRASSVSVHQQDSVSTTTSAQTYGEAIENMAGQPYEQVIATHPIFRQAMTAALSEPLPRFLVERFCGSGSAAAGMGVAKSTRPSVESDASAPRHTHEDVNGAPDVHSTHRAPPSGADALIWRLLDLTSAPGEVGRAVWAWMSASQPRTHAPRSDKLDSESDRRALTCGMQLESLRATVPSPPAGRVAEEAEARVVATPRAEQPNGRRTSSGEMVSHEGGSCDQPATRRSHVSFSGRARVAFAAEPSNDASPPSGPPAAKPRKLMRASSTSSRSFMVASNRALARMPWEMQYRTHAQLPSRETTLEEVLLHPERFTGVHPKQGGLGAHGESAFLLCALMNRVEHRILMHFLLSHYSGPANTTVPDSTAASVRRSSVLDDGDSSATLRKLVCAAYEGVSGARGRNRRLPSIICPNHSSGAGPSHARSLP